MAGSGIYYLKLASVKLSRTQGLNVLKNLFINTSDSFAIPIGGKRHVGVFKRLIMSSCSCL